VTKDELIKRVERLQAELNVRSGSIGFPENKGPYKSAGAAYHSGYERGFRNRPGVNPYTRRDCIGAYELGLRFGIRDSEHAITELLSIWALKRAIK
jgi:hypothetical protein